MSAKVVLMVMVTFLVMCQVMSYDESKEKMDTLDEKTISVGFLSAAIDYLTSEIGLKTFALKLLEFAANVITHAIFTSFY